MHRQRSRAAWLYHESGLASLYATGADAWLVILARTCRMFAFGGISLVFALFFAALDFSDARIGLFMTLTLGGDVALTFAVTMVADAMGRRRVLFVGGFLMALSGVALSYFENFWVLLLAAILGVVSATGSDFGPFRSIEESVLSHLTTPSTRSDVLSWYITTSGLGSAAGIAVTGWLTEDLKGRGWDDKEVYHSLFYMYLIMGVANMALAYAMSQACEMTEKKEAGAGEGDGEHTQGLLDEDEPEAPNTSKRHIAPISAATRAIMYKLWFLLTVDSLADGMVSYALTNYYLAGKFQLSKATLGSIMSATFVLGSVSTVFAGPLARHLGLVNTMVFTHLPSSAAVLVFPAPQGLVLTTILLFIRGGLNNMDQAPRAALIAAVVKPEERTAVMGVTSMMRTLAATIGPSVTGALAEKNLFWVAFVAAGSLRIAYDVGLWVLFINIQLYKHEPAENEPPAAELDELSSGTEAHSSS